MASLKQKTVSVTCPRCGHVQPEPRGAYSTICKECRAHFRLEDKSSVKAAAPKKAEQAPIERKKVICFNCSTELDVPVAAESTMCKRCSGHVDLRDYAITATVSKNYRTHGRLVLEEKGYMMNTDSVVGDAVIKGRIIGKITAKRTLEIFSTARIKGTFTAGRLIVPAGNLLKWPETLKVEGAEIVGELVASIEATGTVVLRSSARLFGDVVAGNLVIESGAVFVGQVKIGKTAPEKEAVVAPARPASRTLASERILRRKPAAA